MLTINALDKAALEVTLFYGVGGFIFFVLSMYAIVIYQIHQFSQNKDVLPLYSTASKIFYYYFGLAASIIILFATLIVVSHSSNANPAVGLYSFFNLPWENIDGALEAIKTSSMYENATANEKVTIESFALIIIGAKTFFTILMFLSYFIIPLFAIYYPFSECYRKNEHKEAMSGCVFNMILSAIIYVALVYFLLAFSQGAINYLISFAVDNGYADASKISADVNYFDVLKSVFKTVKETITE